MLQIFDRFYRLAGQDQPGTGLGLAICRRIAELHGARITMTDGPDGKGLTTTVFLPVAADQRVTRRRRGTRES
ncbi:MAG: ATP-binding protein [Rhodocyclaceae bacterium]|nr:ATP-binding protein [Rhodocyclaceae bacterium]